MKEVKSDRVCCAHYASTYLPLTQNWIYRTLTHHQSYAPIFLTRKKENLNLFPLSPVYSLDDRGKLLQYAAIACFKVFGYFDFMARACRENQAKVLHVHFGYHGVKMTGLKKKLNVPMICSFYGDDVFSFPTDPANRERYQTLFREADKLLVLGPYMKAELIRLGCPEHKITIHHLGIDTHTIRFEKRTVARGGKIRFLIASSFLEKKGIALAIRALAALRTQYDFTLDIIGDGPLKPAILEAIETGGIKDRVTLHGYKPYAYFIELAYRCDVLIQASKTGSKNNKEGTPMAIVDAMATGMAIIATKHSDIPEVAHDSIHGFLAEENDVDSLQQSLARLFEQADRIETFSVAARARVEAEFNAATQTQRLEDYYAELINGHK
jgi:colanic acid/amylovoran biosynthesis glycosyltransferase